MSDDAETRQQLVEQLVQQIRRLDLSLPALMLLDLVGPFSFIASQGLLLCQPVLGFFVDGSRVGAYADLLADPSSLERLAVRLDEERRCDDRREQLREEGG
jgi:hypothetical protein